MLALRTRATNLNRIQHGSLQSKGVWDPEANRLDIRTTVKSCLCTNGARQYDARFLFRETVNKNFMAHRATEWGTNSCGKLSKIHGRSFVQLQRGSGHAASFEWVCAGPFNRTFLPNSTFRVRSRNAQDRRVYGVLIFHRFVNGMSVSFSHSPRISTQWPCS
jgi:hypothetical protein